MSEPMTEERIAQLREWARNVVGRTATPIEECLDKIESLQAHEPTWAELMEVIDKRYPPEVFGKGSDDNTGPRIVALCRENDRLETELAERTKAARHITCCLGGVVDDSEDSWSPDSLMSLFGYVCRMYPWCDPCNTEAEKGQDNE